MPVADDKCGNVQHYQPDEREHFTTSGEAANQQRQVEKRYRYSQPETDRANPPH